MAMDKSASDAFVYAKSSGMLASSFVGKRARLLFSANSLKDLWSLLFKTERPSVPEVLLAKEIEKESLRLFLKNYDSLLKNYSSPHELLVALIHFYEYENLKLVGSALARKEDKLPPVADVSPYTIINYNKWPSLRDMTKETVFSWYDTVPDFSTQKDLDLRLDRQYVKYVWDSALKSDASCRKELLSLIGEKFRMENVVWALRLKLYYDMERSEILSSLAYSSGEKNEHDVLVTEAQKILDFAPDDYQTWSKWKYSFLINPHTEGSVWRIDPRWVYNSYKREFVKKAYRMFHLHPFTDCPMVCWFFIKQNELDNIRTACESLRLGIPGEEALKFSIGEGTEV